MNLKGMEPFGTYVVLEVLPKDNITDGGIILPEFHHNDPYVRGKVVAIGQGYRQPDGTFIPLVIRVNDVVLHNKNSGIHFEHKGKEYIVLQEHEIWMRLK